MITGTSSADIWDVAGDDEPETDDEASLFDPPPRLRRAFLMRLPLLDSLFFTLSLDLSSRSDFDPRLVEGGRLLETPWTSELLSRFGPDGGESVGDEGGLRKGC